MKRIRSFFCALTLVLLLSPVLYAKTFEIDPHHSAVAFKIRNLFLHVDGRFTEFKGSIHYDPKDPSSWSTNATIQAASIDTRITRRDKHLRSADFFDVEKFPIMTFISTGVTDVTETGAKLKGELTLHGVTKPVVLDLRMKGSGEDAKDKTRARFTATTKINRKDFGLVWNRAVEGGGFVIGNEVTVTIEVEAILRSGL